jgi:hypothetical protein
MLMAQYDYTNGGVGAPVGLTVFKTAGGSLGAAPGGFDSHTPLPEADHVCVAISIAYSEKKHFPSLARKKSKGEGTIYDFFKRFFQRSLGKIQRSLGKNLGTVATSFSVSSEKHMRSVRQVRPSLVCTMTCAGYFGYLF